MEQGLNTYFYRVAEHLFAVECADNSLFERMINYEPFRVETHGTTIFTLRMEQDGLVSEEERSHYAHVFTDNSEEDMPRIEVYRSDKTPAEAMGREGDRAPQNATSIFGDPAEARGWLMRVSQIAQSPICCELQSDKDFTQGVLHIAADCQDVRFCIDNALMLMYAFRTAPLMTLEMHAAVVVRGEAMRRLGDEAMRREGNEARRREGDRARQNATSGLGGPPGAEGYLVLGHSGTGKSTHARQWLQAFSDAWLLNDDNPILRVMEDGEVRVYGSPWSGKTPCYKNAHARVGGIIKLSQAPYNQLQPLTLPQAYAYMLSSASGLKMNHQMADDMYNSIKHIITHVKCHHLNCLPNTDAARVCFAGCKV